MSRHEDDSNWLDRGGPPEPAIVRVLAFYLGRDPETVGATLDNHARAIRGLVEADASQRQLVGYLKHVEDESPLPPPEQGRHATAVTLWHIVKAAYYRDQTVLLRTRLRADHPESPPQRLSEWLEQRLVEAPEGTGKSGTDNPTE